MGTKIANKLKVVLFAQARREDPNDARGPFKQDPSGTNRIETNRSYTQSKYNGLPQYWTGHMTAMAFNDRVITQQNN